MSPFYCYVVYSGHRRPLYVGQTCNLAQRMRDHEKRSHWMSRATFISALPAETREEAMELEANRIVTLRPEHNRNVIWDYKRTVVDAMHDANYEALCDEEPAPFPELLNHSHRQWQALNALRTQRGAA